MEIKYLLKFLLLTSVFLCQLHCVKTLDTHNLSNDKLVHSCLNVSKSLIYYKNSLNNFDYEYDNCLNYKNIGNFVLEKNHISENCYKKIEKPLCMLYYQNREGTNIVKENTKNNIRNSTKNNCYETSNLFLDLIKKCIENKDDPSIHCASFDNEKNIITDPVLFCRSSFERIYKNNDKSVFSKFYTKKVIKTISFKKEEQHNCINIANNYNNCSIIELNVFNVSIDKCLKKEMNEKYCNYKIKKVNDKDYTSACFDVFLPYLINSLNEDNTYEQLCNDISIYFNKLKKEKHSYSIEMRNLKEKVNKNKNIIFLYISLESVINEIKDELNNANDINNLFNKLNNLNKNILNDDEYKLNLNKLNDKLLNFEKNVKQLKMPVFDVNSSIENNSSIFNKMKNNTKEIIELHKDISNTCKYFFQYINKKEKKKNTNVTNEDSKIKKIYDDSINTLNKKISKDYNVTIKYLKEQNQDLLKRIDDLKVLDKVYTDQIGYLIHKHYVEIEN